MDGSVTTPARQEKIDPDILAARSASAIGRVGEAGRYYLRAIERSRADRDASGVLVAGVEAIQHLSSPAHRAERLALAEDLYGLPRDEATTEQAATLLAFCGCLFLENANPAKAFAAWDQLEALGGGGDATGAIYALHTRLFKAFLDGRLEEIAASEEAFLTVGEAVGAPGLGMSFARRLPVEAMLLVGRWDEALGLLQGPAGVTVFRRMYALAYAGRHREARQLLGSHLKRHSETIQSNETSIPILVSLLESATLTGDSEATALLAPLLEPAAGAATIGLLGFYPPVSPSRPLGSAAAVLGRFDEARAYYEQSLRLASAIRCRPEIAITEALLAELLVDHFPRERQAAVLHLNQAITDLAEMKMRPALERAIAVEQALDLTRI